MKAQHERRWILLAEDGRHVTLGRESDPTDEELAHAGIALRSQNIGGWLAVLEGNYHQAYSPISLLMIHEVAPSCGTGWAQAEAYFRQRRDGQVQAT